MNLPRHTPIPPTCPIKVDLDYIFSVQDSLSLKMQESEIGGLTARWNQ